MKNTKFSQKLTAITLAAVMVLSMAACDSPSGPGKSGDPGKPGPFVTVDVRAVSEWDYLLVRKDGAAILMNVDDEDITKAKPTRLYYRPNKNSDAGIAMICKENGLPEIMVVNGHIFYFTNFDGYTYDLAVIKPNDDIEYKYGVETETNFDVINGSERAVSDSRAAYNPLTWDIYDWGSMLITVGSCAAAFFVPIPFAG
ncbi:MAG: hypothetical protein LBB89_12065, partial [Treponema sp.]|nr:hypothetical protein [Treponema sp.]